jgi:ferredoxin
MQPRARRDDALLRRDGDGRRLGDSEVSRGRAAALPRAERERVAGSCDASTPRHRIAAAGRPFDDPGCAGCRQLALLRALRRAGFELLGGLGCAPRVTSDPQTPPGRAVRVAGAVEALVRAESLAVEGRSVALLAVVDRGPHRAPAVERALSAAGARVLRVPSDPSAAEAERIVAEALAHPPVALVALAECARREPRRPPLAILPARCNRCGRCLDLGCAAISDPGGEALEVDPASCTGCGRCVPLCRAGALRPPR